ncbi:hypothetical protein [Rhodomicrobium lacus]|uniref:hypothetical protein n=1 Tax=Rhodomicrobium lacus TaxID=2498452 RepID=UPI000F8EFE66|nr:hypothetical protein [Rhodomicrobium lacus]
MTKKAAYAEKTSVSVASSRAELETILERYGATHTAFFNEPGRAMVAFRIGERNVRMTLIVPDKSAPQFQQETVRNNQYRSHTRQATPERAHALWEQACRTKWRALVLAVKAKLVSVEEGIETLEQAFMAHVVMPDGRTVEEHVSRNIALAYQGDSSVRLLPSPDGAR